MLYPLLLVTITLLFLGVERVVLHFRPKATFALVYYCYLLVGLPLAPIFWIASTQL